MLIKKSVKLQSICGNVTLFWFFAHSKRYLNSYHFSRVFCFSLNLIKNKVNFGLLIYLIVPFYSSLRFFVFHFFFTSSSSFSARAWKNQFRSVAKIKRNIFIGLILLDCLHDYRILWRECKSSPVPLRIDIFHLTFGCQQGILSISFKNPQKFIIFPLLRLAHSFSWWSQFPSIQIFLCFQIYAKKK